MQVDVFIAGLPAMVRGLADQVGPRQAMLQAVQDLSAASGIDVDQARRLIQETASGLIDQAERADEPAERRRCVVHGTVACSACWPPEPMRPTLCLLDHDHGPDCPPVPGER
jgi:hypothetical protein